MKTTAILVLVISLLGCVSQEELNRKQMEALKRHTEIINQALMPYAERGDQITKEYKLLDKEVKALKIESDKHEKEKASFLASLSDKELQAYSVFNQASAGHDDAGLALAQRNLMDLLLASGKLEAWFKLIGDTFEIQDKKQALFKKWKELEAREKQLEEEEKSFANMYRDSMKESEEQMFRAQMLDEMRRQTWEMDQQTMNQNQMLWEMQRQNIGGYK